MNFKVQHYSTRGVDNEKEMVGGERNSPHWNNTVDKKINRTTCILCIFLSFISKAECH